MKENCCDAAGVMPCNSRHLVGSGSAQCEVDHTESMSAIPLLTSDLLSMVHALFHDMTQDLRSSRRKMLEKSPVGWA